jgi:hypothetical protein
VDRARTGKTWCVEDWQSDSRHDEVIMVPLLKAAVKRLPPFQALVRERNELRGRLAAADEVVRERDQLRTSLAAAETLVRERDAQLAAQRVHLSYDHDGMRLYGKSVVWMQEEAFVRAYHAGMDSGHKIVRPAGSRENIHIEWRIHILCWAARHARHLPGDFVECGVNTGIFSLAVCHYIDFNSTGKTFYLFDTFNGIPEDQMLPTERPYRIPENQAMYEECYETALRNFAPFPRARLVRGKVPDTLSQVAIDKVCYLSLDMNIAAPEIAAIEFFWDKLVSGGVVVLDDYGWQHYSEQQRALDAFATRKGVAIATLPTGQGLLLKP